MSTEKPTDATESWNLGGKQELQDGLAAKYTHSAWCYLCPKSRKSRERTRAVSPHLPLTCPPLLSFSSANRWKTTDLPAWSPRHRMLSERLCKTWAGTDRSSKLALGPLKGHLGHGSQSSQAGRIAEQGLRAQRQARHQGRHFPFMISLNSERDLRAKELAKKTFKKKFLSPASNKPWRDTSLGKEGNTTFSRPNTF